MSKERIKNSTKPKKVLHLDTLSQPSPRNLFKFRRKKEQIVGFRRENTEPEGFVRSLFRFCTKLKKVSLRRLRECIQVKNLFRFRRIFLLFLSTFELIWKLFASAEPFLVGFGKNLISFTVIVLTK